MEDVIGEPENKNKTLNQKMGEINIEFETSIDLDNATKYKPNLQTSQTTQI